MEPIRRSMVPVGAELIRGPGEADDPLDEDGDSPVPGLVHRYPDRVLFLVTNFCATYCRYCTRARMVGHTGEYHFNPGQYQQAIDYVAGHPEVRDVLLSGGDPLTMGDDRLEWILERLRAIRHVEFLRIGTKIPAVLPQRITPALVRMLRRFHPLWMSIHFMHPAELTPEVKQACERLADAGIPLGSQTVLTRGINDDVATMRKLVQGLLRFRVRPYYLYQCDPITGSEHLRTPIEKGLEIVAGLRGHTTGYASPTFVVDAPQGGGKIALLPEAFVGRDGDSVLLRNYAGEICAYPDPVPPQPEPAAVAPRGRPDRARARGNGNGNGHGRALRRGGLRLALVYDLRDDYLAAGWSAEDAAEFDPPETIDSIEAALQALGHAVARVGHVRELTRRLAAGERWDLVFNTAEGVAGFGRESQVPALLDAFGIPYTFSDPLVCALTLHKGMAKRVLRDAGVPTTDFRVVADEDDLARLDLPFPLFAKPVAEGTAKGIDGGSLWARCRHLWATWQQPVLLEPFLPGREFTVGILGSGREAEAVGTLEVLLRPGAEPHAYSFVNKERCEDLCEYRLADAEAAARVERLALAAWRALGARDAGRVDLREDAEGRAFVLEANPLPGLHPTHSDLPMICSARGIAYVELLRRIVDSAATRVPRRGTARAARTRAARSEAPRPALQ
jgi:KamA family protein/D-alanine--D-alanine ligase